MNAQHYIVFDLEATCSDVGEVPRHEMETIEIGACAVEAKSLQVIEEYQAFIRPVRHPKLTEFCRELTSITQEEVDAARGFPEVFWEFVDWADSYASSRLGSWGQYDANQLQQDCQHHGVEYPLGDRHFNLKAQFATVQGCRPMGILRALTRVGMQFEGRNHRGIDDARNIARLLPFILGPPPAASSK